MLGGSRIDDGVNLMTDVDALAGALLHAYETRHPVSPLTQTYDALTVDDA